MKTPIPATEESSATQITIGSRVRVKENTGEFAGFTGYVVDRFNEHSWSVSNAEGTHGFTADELELLPDEETPNPQCQQCGAFHRPDLTVCPPDKETPASLRAEATRLDAQANAIVIDDETFNPPDEIAERGKLWDEAEDLRARADAMEGKFACPACCDTGSFRAQGQVPCPDCAQAPTPDQACPTKGAREFHTGGIFNPDSDPRQWVWGPTAPGKQSGEVICKDAKPEHAELFADALNTHAATGLTPSQLLTGRDEWVEAARAIRKVADAHADTIREESEAKIAAEEQRDSLRAILESAMEVGYDENGWQESARQALAAIRK